VQELDCGVSAERASGARHWDDAYAHRGLDGVSWFQATPRVSLDLIESLGAARESSVIDVGGGPSFLVDELVARGYTDLTVLDISAVALDGVRHRLPAGAPVSLLEADLLTWRPTRRYDVWHDRAVFHFLTGSAARARYLRALRAAVAPRGAVVVATFADDGPSVCSGLPVQRYSSEELVAALGEPFTLVETRREEHVTPRGAIQPFTWVAGVLG
jgi:SAM-dependent methyltransferase